MKVLPATAEALVNELDGLYPERSPSPHENDRELWMRAGERRLVRALLRRLNITHQEQMKSQTE